MTPLTLDLVTITWETENMAVWRSLTIAGILVAGFFGTLALSIRAFGVARERRLNPAVRVLAAAVTAAACVACTLWGYTAVYSDERETWQHSQQHLEADGTIASITVMETISESNAGPARLGLRLEEQPQLLLSVAGTDIDRFVGREGASVALYCDLPKDLTTAVTLSCSSRKPAVGLRGLFVSPPDETKHPAITTRTPVEVGE